MLMHVALYGPFLIPVRYNFLCSQYFRLAHNSCSKQLVLHTYKNNVSKSSRKTDAEIQCQRRHQDGTRSIMTGESSLAITGSSRGVLPQLSSARLTMTSAVSEGIVSRKWTICSPLLIVMSGRLVVDKMATATWTKIMQDPAITEPNHMKKMLKISFLS